MKMISAGQQEMIDFIRALDGSISKNPAIPVFWVVVAKRGSTPFKVSQAEGAKSQFFRRLDIGSIIVGL